MNRNTDLDTIREKLKGERGFYKAKHLFLFHERESLIREISDRWRELTDTEKYFFLNSMDEKAIRNLIQYLDRDMLENERLDIKELILKKGEIDGGNFQEIDYRYNSIRNCMSIEISAIKVAIEASKNCASEDGGVKPKVGAAVIKNDEVLCSAYRGEKKPGEHAEYTLLSKIKESYGDIKLDDAILVTTLEPCTTRHLDKNPCAQHVINHRFRKVIIGIIDPNPEIRGKGILILQKHGIFIDLFPGPFAKEVWEINKEFINEEFRKYWKHMMKEMGVAEESRYESKVKEMFLESKVDKIDELLRQTEDIRLFNKVSKYLASIFTMDDLKTLCLNLGLDWDEIQGEKKSGKIAWLLVEMRKLGDDRFNRIFAAIGSVWPDYLALWEERHKEN